MDAPTYRQYVETYRSLWPDRGFLCDLRHESPSDERIKQPVLIIRGANDPSVPPVHAAHLEALCPNHETFEVDAETLVWLARAAEAVWQRRSAFLAGAQQE